MPNMSEKDPSRSRSEAFRGPAIEKPTSPQTRATDNSKPQSEASNGSQSAAQSVLTFVQEHPVVAAGGALAAGAAIAMLVHSRRVQANRLDRRLMRGARDMERKFAREVRALRNSDFADRAGRMTSSLGDVLSRVDFNGLADRGQSYLDALRNRMLR